MTTTDETNRTMLNPRSSRRRRGLAGLALVLACLTILLATVSVWVHQVAFNTDRFTALTVKVLGHPELIAPISARVSDQIVVSLDVQSRVAARLPDIAKPLAPTITAAVRDAINNRLQIALANPDVQDALVKTVSFAHARIMNLLRDKADSVTVVDGYVMVEVFPLIGTALTELQKIGLIPPDVTLPDLSQPADPGTIRQRLGDALKVALPEDFGTIKLMPADKLLTARTAVKAFDFLVVALIILSVLLVALALWLARDRRHMLIFLAIGIVISFLLSRLIISNVEDAVVAGIKATDLQTGLRMMIDAAIEDLRGWTAIILIATGVIGVVAYLWGRPKWAVAAVASVTGAGDKPADPEA